MGKGVLGGRGVKHDFEKGIPFTKSLPFLANVPPFLGYLSQKKGYLLLKKGIPFSKKGIPFTKKRDTFY